MKETYAKILAGVKKFQEHDYKINQPLFEYYKDKQNPKTLFITCSDSRINPALITQTNPGDLFIIRNAGNIIPPVTEAKSSGELATVEYAVQVLKVENIIVCGHSDCGALRALINNSTQALNLNFIDFWLNNIEAVKDLAKASHPDCNQDNLHHYCIEENIILQIKNLLNLPFIKTKVAAGELTLHGWFYDIGSGNIRELNHQTKTFTAV